VFARNRRSKDIASYLSAVQFPVTSDIARLGDGVNVRLTNHADGRQLDIQIPEHLSALGLKDIVLDTGAYDCLFPMSVANELGISPPSEQETGYEIVGGIAGVAVAYARRITVKIQLEYKGKQCGAAVWPSVFYRNAACVTAGSFVPGTPHDWVQQHKYDSEVLPFVYPKATFQEDGFVARFEAPQKPCPKHRCRLPLYTNQMEELPFLIIGRSWLQFFVTTLRRNKIVLRRRLARAPSPFERLEELGG